MSLQKKMQKTSRILFISHISGSKSEKQTLSSWKKKSGKTPRHDNTSVCTPGLCELPSVGSFSEALFPKSKENTVKEAETEIHRIHNNILCACGGKFSSNVGQQHVVFVNTAPGQTPPANNFLTTARSGACWPLFCLCWLEVLDVDLLTGCIVVESHGCPSHLFWSNTMCSCPIPEVASPLYAVLLSMILFTSVVWYKVLIVCLFCLSNWDVCSNTFLHNEFEDLRQLNQKWLWKYEPR